MIEWISVQSDIVKFAIGVAFADLLLLINIGVRSRASIRKEKHEEAFAELERTCGKMS